MNCCNVDINQLVTIWCHWSESPTIIKFLCDYGKADRGLHHEEMHAVDHRIHVREDPPVDEESQKRASVAARALMLLDPDRRELMLDELVDHAAAWAVAQALGADADGAAARMFVYACCSRM